MQFGRLLRGQPREFLRLAFAERLETLFFGQSLELCYFRFLHASTDRVDVVCQEFLHLSMRDACTRVDTGF